MSDSTATSADLDAGTITRTVVADAPIETVYDLLTSSDAIEQWWGHPNEFPDGIRPGSLGVFRWQELTFPVRIDVVDRPHRFGLTWGSGQELDDEATTVLFTLTEVDGGTSVTVLESGFDRMDPDRRRAQMTENTAGWTEVLDSFVRHVSAAAA